MTCKKHNWMPATVEMAEKGYRWYCYNAGCSCKRKTDPAEVVRDLEKIAKKMAKAKGEIEKRVRYLVYSMTFNRGIGKYDVQIIEAASANLASGTGLTCNIYLDKDEVTAIRKWHNLPKGHNLFGVPVIGIVTTHRVGGPVSGWVRYGGNVY